MKKLQVKLGANSYPILIGSGIRSQLGKHLLKIKPSHKLAVLTSQKIEKLYRREMEKCLKGFDVEWLVIPDGEKHKNLQTVADLYRKMIRRKLDRKTTLVAFGGGVVGDIGGFVAATFLRGIPFVQVPTTLLAQVDSSVGGKTGVDLPEGKNLVGAFYQPRLVLIDTDFLKTLPPREYRCGLAEVVKYGALGDEKFFVSLEKNVGKINALDHNTLIAIIAHCCRMKGDIVSRDEKESGERALLNLGHTMGHAVETLSGYSLLHGEAVAIGMVYAAHLSQILGHCADEVEVRLAFILQKLGLPVEMPKFSSIGLARIIQADKKAVGKKIRYVALKKIGEAFLTELTPQEITQAIL